MGRFIVKPLFTNVSRDCLNYTQKPTPKFQLKPFLIFYFSVYFISNPFIHRGYQRFY
nr:MAG TPA: hypothetical protein [Caudoviricetes sp.]